MARQFSGGQYLRHAAYVVGAYPLTMACWVYATDDTITSTLMGVYNIADSDQSLWMDLSGTEVGNPFRVFGRDTSYVRAEGGLSSIYNAWTHYCGVFASDSSYLAYINGVLDTSGNAGFGSPNPTGINRLEIGGLYGGGNPHYGRIAEAAAWNAVLTAAEVGALARGVIPSHVRPGSVAAYWPLWGTHTDEPDMRAGYLLTVTGATRGDHAPVGLFSRSTRSPLIQVASEDAAGSGDMPGSVTIAGSATYGIFDSGSGAEMIGAAIMSGLGFYSPQVVGSGAMTGGVNVDGAGAYFDPVGGVGGGTLRNDPIMSGIGFYTPPPEPVTPLPPSGLISCVVSFSGIVNQIPVYDLDDVVRVIATYTDLVTGFAVDPTTVVFRLRTPGEPVVESITPTRGSVGVYNVDVTVNKVGTWRFRWQATGTGEDGEFVVVSTLAD